VVLNDGRDAAHVRSLLPGSATCAVIVTSRQVLPHMTGAFQHRLEVLDPDDARALFTRVVGSERGSGEPAAMDLGLEDCGGLPLAIRIAASRLASRPAWTAGFLAARLSDERLRLRELAVGDLAVRASISVSYRALFEGDVQAAALFRLLGLTGTETISLPAA